MVAKKSLKSLILTDSADKERPLKKFLGRSYAVISTDGFLKDLPKSRIGIDENFQPDYITVRGKGPLLAELKKEALNARRVFLATGSDLRGEFLARQLCEVFGVNQYSNCRMYFEEMTKDAVKNSLENARPIDNKLADSFQAKQIIDKFVSHKIGEYLSCKIYRGVKVGRFRAMLLNLVNSFDGVNEFEFGKNLTFAGLQILAAKELNFSTSRTRIIAEQLFDGINFEKEGYGGLITFPYGTIKLSSENRAPSDVKEYLTENQFKLYDLIYSNVNGIAGKISAPDELNDLAMMIKLESIGIDWADVYSIGIASLIKRKYITADNFVFKMTELGRRVLAALDGYFDEDFSVDAYKKITAKVKEIAEGKAEKSAVIENYCKGFEKNFNRAMEDLGEDAKPQDKPEVDSGEICEKCGKPMLIKHGRYGFFLACSGYPDCKNVKPYVKYLEQKCPKCGKRLTKREFGRGKNLCRCENDSTCDFHTWDEPQTVSCKVCDSTMFVHKFKNRPSMFYCGNENCPTRKDHPINKIIEESKKRSEARKKAVAKCKFTLSARDWREVKRLFKLHGAALKSFCTKCARLNKLPRIRLKILPNSFAVTHCVRRVLQMPSAC